MPAERYYYPKPLETGDTIFLQDQEFHHLIHVMRGREGDPVEIVNGMGQLAQGAIQKIEKKKAALSLTSVFSQNPPETTIILAQGIPRQNRLDFIAEKCTELGMTELWLFPATKSEKKEFSENQLERVKGITVAAMKQCGRLHLPQIKLMPPLKQWRGEDAFLMFFGDTSTNAPQFLSAWGSINSQTKQALFCIGPESGLTEEEEATLRGIGAHGVSLHPNILRTDTAAIAAMTLLSAVVK
jgi:16S rRNA (uracil1498-N3)-methyltransferase